MNLRTFWFRQSNFISRKIEVFFSSLIFGIVILVVGGVMNIWGAVVLYWDLFVGVPSMSKVNAFYNPNSSDHFDLKIKKMLGFSQPAIYLVVLMNKSEARPLGGFRGSFAKVEVLSWQIQNIEIHDSYRLPSIKKEHFCDQALEDIGFSKCIGFVDSARVWFTDYDGKVVKTLYEKTFSWEKIQGVIFLRSDLLDALIPEYINYHLMREFWNASSKISDNRPNKDKYRSFVNAFVSSYQNKMIKRALELFFKDPSLFENKIYFYIPGLKQGFEKRQRPYLSGGFYWFDTDRSFTKWWLFVNKEIYVWENGILRYIWEGGHLGSYTGANIHIRAVYRYNFDLHKQAIKIFDALQKMFWVNLTDKTKYVLGYYSYIKSLSQIYYPNKYVLKKTTIDEPKIWRWRASNVVYFLRDRKFSGARDEVIMDFWLEQKKFLK